MPDDMLEDVITVAKKALDENEFEEHGVEVSMNFLFTWIVFGAAIAANTLCETYIDLWSDKVICCL